MTLTLAKINGRPIGEISKWGGRLLSEIGSIRGITVPSGGISIVQDWFGTTADGSAGLTVPLAVSRVVRTTATAAGTNGKYFRIKDGLGNTLLTGTCGTAFAAGANAAAYAANIAAWVSAHLAAINALSAGVSLTTPLVIVAGAGLAGTDGNYPYSGQAGDSVTPTYTAGSPLFNSILWNPGSSQYEMYVDAVGDTSYVTTNSPTFPTQGIWVKVNGVGIDPAPTVTAPSFDTTFALGAFANAYVFETDDPALSCADVNPDPYASMIVTGIGAGTYTWRGLYDSPPRPFYNLAGQPTSSPDLDADYLIAFDGSHWYITGSDGSGINTATSSDESFPNLASWTGSTVNVAPAGRDAILAGNAVVAAISFDNGSGDGLSVDPVLIPSGTLTRDVFAENGVQVDIWERLNVAGGETGITFSTNDHVRASMQVLEVSGLANAAVEDTQSGLGAGTTAALDAPIVPDSAKNFLTFSVSADVDISSGTAPVGWTEATPPGGIGGSPVFQRTFTLIQSAATSQNPTMTIPSAAWTAVAAARGGV